jgi:hypothetical protein
VSTAVPPRARKRLGLKLALILLVNAGILEAADWLTGQFGPAYHVAVVRKQRLDRPKRPGEKRVFVYGESTVFGWPYEEPNSTARWLEVVLSGVLPGERVRCINFGRPARGSAHLHAAVTETVGCEPDVVVLSIGHNEFLPYSYPFLQNPVHRWTYFHSNIYRNMNDAVSRSRGRQAADAAAYYAGIPPDTPLHREIVANYRRQMDAMIAAPKAAGVPVVVCVPASNLAGQEPIGSLLAESLDGPTLTELQTAMRLSWLGEWRPGPEFDHLMSRLTAAGFEAQAQYLNGKRHEAEGRFDAAHDAFVRARDLDRMPIRCKTEMAAQLRELTATHGVPLVELPDVFRAAGNGRAPGLGLFVDAMHPRPVGQYLMAVAIARRLAASGLVAPASDWHLDRLPSFEACAGRIYSPEQWRAFEREWLCSEIQQAPGRAIECARHLPPLATAPDPEWTAFEALALWSADRHDEARRVWRSLTVPQREDAARAVEHWAAPTRELWEKVSAELK